VEEQPAPVPWHAADLAAFVGFFIAAVFIIPFAGFLALRAFVPGMTEPPPLGLIAAQALINLAVVGFIFFIIRLHGQTVAATLHWIRTDIHVGWLISTGIFLALSVLIVSSLFPEPSDSPFDKLLTSPASIAAFAILGIVVAPITEEIMFRGFLYKLLTDLYGSSLAVPVTTMAFAGLHFLQLWGNWGGMALIVVVGFVLTKVRQQTNSLVPSVIIHTAYNSLIFGLAALSWVFQK
jgi:membrane protease YdiL (CAAX protease family)